MKKLLLVLITSVFALTACGAVGGSVTTLNVPDFSKKISDKSVVLLDVRTPAEFATGHIVGATNMDFESGNFAKDLTGLDKSRNYAVYCRSGNRSGQATSLMAKDGFTSVFNLNGGIIDWQGAGNNVVNNG